MWRETTLLTDRAVQLETAKTNDLPIRNQPSKSVEQLFRTTEKYQRSDGDRRFVHDWLGSANEIQKMMAELRCEPDQFQRKDHLHVNVQRLCMERTRKQRELYCGFCQRCKIRQKVSARMLVISGTWLWEKVVWNSCQHAKRWMEQNCWSHDAQIC